MSYYGTGGTGGMGGNKHNKKPLLVQRADKGATIIYQLAKEEYRESVLKSVFAV